MRDIKKEMLLVKGGDFIEWYLSLTKLERLEYKKILDNLGKK